MKKKKPFLIGGVIMNFIFISPHFPESYWLFCQGLKNNGVNVLAIADAPYESLSTNLKNSINEYYKVNSMENYDEMLRAVAFYTFKYGKIDWIESNNEYWLRQDARLRMDFNIANGLTFSHMDDFQSKSRMKTFYQKAQLPTARYCIVSTLENALEFIQEVGYPIVIKPDIGVGSSDTRKIRNQEELETYFKHPRMVKMIMEEYINGESFSFDGITDSHKKVLFMTSHQYTDSIMDSVNEQKTIGCYSYMNIPEDILDAGLRTVKAFNTRSRFFHFEFFVLSEDQPGVGNQGDVLGLEVNMRPPGGFLPDLINYANDFNIYQLWADMIVTNQTSMTSERPYSAVFMGRKDCLSYQYSLQDIRDEFKEAVLDIRRLPSVLAEAMGDVVVLARFKTTAEVERFVAACSRLADNS